MTTSLGNFCDASRFHPVWAQGADPLCNLMQCTACGLVRNAVIPCRETLAGYYDDAYYEADKGKRFFSPFERLMMWTRVSHARAIMRVLRNPGKVLDIGCGRGEMLAFLARHGWQAEGTQVSQNALAAARKRGLTVYEGALPDLRLPERSYDVITMWHVLEHVDDPLGYLGEVKRMLMPGGFFFVEVPNFSGLGARFFKRHWFALELPRHVYHFREEVLTKMLETLGFAVVRKGYFSWDQSLFTLLQSMLNAIVPAHNALFDFLKVTRVHKHYFSVALSLILSAVLLIPAAVLTVAGVFMKKGEVLSLICVHREKTQENASWRPCAHYSRYVCSVP